MASAFFLFKGAREMQLHFPLRAFSFEYFTDVQHERETRLRDAWNLDMFIGIFIKFLFPFELEIAKKLFLTKVFIETEIFFIDVRFIILFLLLMLSKCK